jgi:hypothetical protein
MDADLVRFNKQAVGFLKDLYKILPSYSYIGVLEAQAEVSLMVNQEILLDNFMLRIYPYKRYINAKDESFFLNPQNLKAIANEDAKYQQIQNNEDYFESSLKLRDLWKHALRKENKEMVWTYFRVMIILVERAIAKMSAAKVKTKSWSRLFA